MDPNQPASPTKTCTGCGAVFTLQDVIDDPIIQPRGMQFEDEDLEWNSYYFNHVCDHCGSTFTISVKEFLPYITEPIPPEVLTGSGMCEQHCLSIQDLQECHAPCMYAPFRRFLLRTLKKSA